MKSRGARRSGEHRGVSDVIVLRVLRLGPGQRAVFGLDRLAGGFDQGSGFLDSGRGGRFGVAGVAGLLDVVEAAFGLEGFAAEADGAAA